MVDDSDDSDFDQDSDELSHYGANIIRNDSYVPEVQLPSKLYNNLLTQFPPNPLLPKNFIAKDDSPRSGGVYKFMKLTKFRGMDHGRSKFREEASKIEKIGFPDGITMRKIFKVISKDDGDYFGGLGDAKGLAASAQDLPSKPGDKGTKQLELTQYGELVYQRNSTKDFIAKQKMFFHEQQDEVLAENLIDVRNLLKNATSSQAGFGKQAGQKALVNL